MAIMNTREQKSSEIASLAEKFGRAKAAFLVDFKGMTVEQVTDLRKKLVTAESEMKVVRNTLALRALGEHPESKTALEKSLTGNNAIVFAFGEAPVTAKALSDFAKNVEILQLKAGVMEGSALNKAGINALANLPSKDVLRAQFLGVLNAPASKFVRTLNAVPSGFARVLGAQRDKLGGA